MSTKQQALHDLIGEVVEIVNDDVPTRHVETVVKAMVRELAKSTEGFRSFRRLVEEAVCEEEAR